MLKYFNERRRKGQSTLEYAVLIIIIIGALLSIQVYIKRGIQGRLKQATDDIGDQFSPGNTNVVKRVTTSSYTREVNLIGREAKTLLNNEVTNTSLNATIMQQDQEYWGG
jgi:hypothetical protein